MPTEKPRRRWFRPRYSLATLFAVVTLVGCWLGVQVKWVRERREMLATHRFDDGVFFQDVSMAFGQEPPVPWSLRLFGERGVYKLIVHGEDEQRRAKYEARARRLFPEAEIEVDPLNRTLISRSPQPRRHDAGVR